MFEVGQKVWCVMFGEGVVTEVLTENAIFPMEVRFGDVLEHYTLGGKYRTYVLQTLFPYPVEIVKKVTKPSINWEHVRGEYKFLVQDIDGSAWLYCEEPELGEVGWYAELSDFALADSHVSCIPGTCDWKDSLVARPKSV